MDLLFPVPMNVFIIYLSAVNQIKGILNGQWRISFFMPEVSFPFCSQLIAFSDMRKRNLMTAISNKGAFPQSTN
jgi:hypothetical protein